MLFGNILIVLDIQKSMKRNKLVDYSIVFIGIVVLVIVLQELASILRPLALAAFFTILLMPIYDFAKRKKIPAFVPITGIFIILIAAIAAPYPLSIFITVMPGEQLDNMLFKAAVPF